MEKTKTKKGFGKDRSFLYMSQHLLFVPEKTYSFYSQTPLSEIIRFFFLMKSFILNYFHQQFLLVASNY